MSERNTMRSYILLAITLLLTIVPARADDELESAEESALSWLTLTDHSQLESSWNIASPFFQTAISESDWVHSLNAARSSLGAVNSRKTASATFSRTLPDAPDGSYIVFQFETSFENKASATETVAMVKDTKGVWRVGGYFIE